MGIKELDHLKKSLSEIKSKSSKLRKNEEKLDGFELDDFRTKERIEGLEISIKVWTNKISKLKKQIDNADFSRMEKTEFSNIKNEIKQINQEIKSSGKVMKEEDAITEKFDGLFGVVLILWIVIPFVLTPFLGAGWITLVISDADAEYECANGDTVPAYYVNDGEDDCGDNSDEDVYETEELKEAMEKSSRDSDYAMGGYCCGIPILLYFLYSMLRTSEISMKMVSDDDIQKLAKLKNQMIPYQNKEQKFNMLRGKLNSEKGKLRGAKIQLDKKQLYVVKLQNSITKTEQEIKDLRDSIEETYASIKHLIPYSDYL